MKKLVIAIFAGAVCSGSWAVTDTDWSEDIAVAEAELAAAQAELALAVAKSEQDYSPRQYIDDFLFNHSGIQKGAIAENCYHNPCSIVKVMDFKLLENEPDHHFIKLKVVGGTQAWNSKRIIWNHNFHNLYIMCSLQSPSIQNGDGITKLAINPDDGLPGVLWGDGQLYSQACHNFTKGDTTDLAKKYGYNIREDNW